MTSNSGTTPAIVSQKSGVNPAPISELIAFGNGKVTEFNRLMVLPKPSKSLESPGSLSHLRLSLAPALSIDIRCPVPVLSRLKEALICRLQPPDLDAANLDQAVLPTTEAVCPQTTATLVVHVGSQGSLTTIDEHLHQVLVDENTDFEILSRRQVGHDKRCLGLPKTDGARLGPDQNWEAFAIAGGK